MYVSKLQRPRLVYSPTRSSFARDGTLDKVKSLRQVIVPPPWCWSSSFQIIYFLIRNAWCDRIAKFTNENIMTKRGFINIAWANKEPLCDNNDGPPILLFLHGLMCSSDDLPGTSFIHAAIQRGWKVVVHNRPGHSSPLKTPRWSMFGDWRDVDVVVKHIRTKFPTRHVAAIGFSAGAFPLLKYLGEAGVHSGLDAAVCVSGSVKLSDSLDHCSWLFMKIFLHEGKKFFLQANEQILRQFDTLAYDRVMATTTSRDFMAACVPFVTGIKGCYDWTIAKTLLCPYSTIQEIDTPVLFLNAMDDPIVPPKSIQPYEENVFRTNPNLLLAISATGSHCPFLHGCFSPEDYSMKTCLEFVAHQAAIVRLRKTAKAAAIESTRRVSYTEKKKKKMKGGGGGGGGGGGDGGVEEEEEEDDFVSPRTSTLRKRYMERVPLATVATNTAVTK